MRRAAGPSMPPGSSGDHYPEMAEVTWSRCYRLAVAQSASSTLSPLNPPKSWEVGILLPIVQMGTQSPREVKKLAKGMTFTINLNPGQFRKCISSRCRVGGWETEMKLRREKRGRGAVW